MVGPDQSRTSSRGRILRDGSLVPPSYPSHSLRRVPPTSRFQFLAEVLKRLTGPRTSPRLLTLDRSTDNETWSRANYGLDIQQSSQMSSPNSSKTIPAKQHLTRKPELRSIKFDGLPAPGRADPSGGLAEHLPSLRSRVAEVRTTKRAIQTASHGIVLSDTVGFH